jgi:hypothetical protein
LPGACAGTPKADDGTNTRIGHPSEKCSTRLVIDWTKKWRLDTLALGTVRIDATPPVLAENKPVSEKIQTDRPSHAFKTSKTETLNFSGKGKGNVDKAIAGINHITLHTTKAGTYDDYTMTPHRLRKQPKPALEDLPLCGG